MAMPKTPPYWDEKIFGATHKYREYPQRAKGTSSFVFVFFSIFVYISIFYVFNLSPSTFLNNNKFWFFISNTLILIIAADYGAFSSSKNNRDFYEEYVMHKQARSSVASFVPQYPETVKKSTTTTTSPPEEEVESFGQEKTKQISTNAPHQENEDNQEKKGLEIVIWSEPEKMIDEKRKNYRRSKSEKPRRVEIDESKNIVRRSDSVTEKSDGDLETESCVEENEFSNMSDEELNRRVEEFIQKFNRQIRLQRAGNFC